MAEGGSLPEEEFAPGGKASADSKTPSHHDHLRSHGDRKKVYKAQSLYTTRFAFIFVKDICRQSQRILIHVYACVAKHSVEPVTIPDSYDYFLSFFIATTWCVSCVLEALWSSFHAEDRLQKQSPRH